MEIGLNPHLQRLNIHPVRGAKRHGTDGGEIVRIWRLELEESVERPKVRAHGLGWASNLGVPCSGPLVER